MSKATVVYQGGQASYSFPFDYLTRAFVKVDYIHVDGTSQPLNYGVDYKVVDKMIMCTLVSDATDRVKIYRQTPTTQLVTFVDSSILRSKDLNALDIQLLHISEESMDRVDDAGLSKDESDGKWNAKQATIKNVPDGVATYDAVNKGQLDAIAGSATSAAESAASAKQSEINANLAAVSNQIALVESTSYGVLLPDPIVSSGLQITVPAGVYHMPDGKRYSVATSTITCAGADGTSPRIDLIYLSSAGVVSYVAGSPALSPIAPSGPTGSMALCTAYIGAGSATALVTDARVIKMRIHNNGCVSVKDFGAIGDGIHDDTFAIGAGAKYAVAHNLSLVIPKTSAFYKLTDSIHVYLGQGQSFCCTSNYAELHMVSIPTSSMPYGSLSGMVEGAIFDVYSSRDENAVDFKAKYAPFTDTSIRIEGLVLNGIGVPVVSNIDSITLGVTPILMGIQAQADFIDIRNVRFKNIFGNGLRMFGGYAVSVQNVVMQDVGGRPGTPFKPSAGGMSNDSFGDGIYIAATKVGALVKVSNAHLTGYKTLGHFNRGGIVSENAQGAYIFDASEITISYFAKSLHLEDNTMIDGAYYVRNASLSNFNMAVAAVSLTDSLISLTNVKIYNTVAIDGFDSATSSGFATQFSCSNTTVRVTGCEIHVTLDYVWMALSGRFEFYETDFLFEHHNPFFADGSVLFVGCHFIKAGGVYKTFYSSGPSATFTLVGCAFSSDTSSADIFGENCAVNFTACTTDNQTLRGTFIGSTYSPTSPFAFSKDATGNDPVIVSVQSRTEPNKGLRIGYDITNNRGYLQAATAGYANTPLYLNPNGGNVGVNGYASMYPLTVSGTTAPSLDNLHSLGSTSNRWSQLFAGSATINTSDANEKQQVAALSDKEVIVAQALKKLVKTFKFNDAVEAKGDKARIHVGVMAQDVYKAFAEQGLSASDYALFCSDTWYEVNGQSANDEGILYDKDSEGAVERTRLGIRYEELLAFIISAL